MAKTKTPGRLGIVLGGALLLSVTAMSGANLYLLLEERDNLPAVSAQAPPPEPPAAPVFAKVGPITVNLQDDRYGSRLLFTGLSLKVGSQEVADQIVEYMPQVQSHLLVLLSAKKADELTKPGGKSALAGEIRALLNKPLAPGLSPLVVNEVLFTDFIVQ